MLSRRLLGMLCFQRTYRTGNKLNSYFIKHTTEHGPNIHISSKKMSNSKIESTARMFIPKRYIYTTKLSCMEKEVDKPNEYSEKDRQVLQKWIEMMRCEGENVPQYITEKQFEMLLPMGSAHRSKYLHFLFVRERAQENYKIKKAERREIYLSKLNERFSENSDHIQYGLWHNSMFAKSHRKDITTLHNCRLLTAMLFAQPLIFDLGFDHYMKGREIESYAKQLQLSIILNRTNENPFNLSFCNVNFNTACYRSFAKQMPNIKTPNFPVDISSEDYLDKFPRDKLVYLTPNAREEMLEYDHDAIYIVGGIVDLGAQHPITMAKAKKQKIKMQKLPIDRYVLFRHNKSLGIHIMMAILLEMKNSGDWRKAFKNIPSRLVVSGDPIDSSHRWNRKIGL